MKPEDLKAQARALGDQIREGEGKLAKGRTGLRALMAKASEEGTLGTKEFNDAFEEASRPVDGLAEDIEEKRRSFNSVMSQIGERPGSGNPLVRPADHDGKAVGWGDRFISSESYQELKASRLLDQKDTPIGQRAGVLVTHGLGDVKAVLTSANYPLVPQREPDYVPLPQETVTILDLISIGTSDAEIVEWVVQTLRTNAAASVAEGADAPESAFDWDIVQKTAQEIAHFHAATKRAIRDEGQLRTLIDDEMISGLRVKLQNLIISGAGVGTDFTGILNTANIGSVACGAAGKGDVYGADAIHRAMTTIRIAGLGAVEPTAVGIHPTDFEAHALAKDKNDNYINGGPGTNGPASVWGLRPVVHTAFPEGNPVIGDYKQAKLWINSDVTLTTTDTHADFFRKRLVAVMATFMGVFGVLRPSAFCEVTGFVGKVPAV